MTRALRKLNPTSRTATMFCPKHLIGQMFHTALPLHVTPDGATRAAARDAVLAPLSADLCASMLWCFDYVRDLVALADSFRFEPPLHGMVPDLEMRHHHHGRTYGYVIEIKTVWKESPGAPVAREFGKGVRQVQHGLALMRQKNPDYTGLYGAVLAFVIYADGSRPEALWLDVA